MAYPAASLRKTLNSSVCRLRQFIQGGTSSMNIPNTITLLRIFMTPLFVYLLLQGAYTAAIWVLLGAGFSDVLDGFIARRFNKITFLGSILDPLADKILITIAAVALAWIALLPWWLAAVICLRDLVIVGGATVYYLRARRIEMDPTVSGKLNTFVQFLLIFLVLVNANGMMTLAGLLPALFVLALLTTAYSGVLYILVWGRKGAELKTKATCGH